MGVMGQLMIGASAGSHYRRYVQMLYAKAMVMLPARVDPDSFCEHDVHNVNQSASCARSAGEEK
jgi:hypothetical protein